MREPATSPLVTVTAMRSRDTHTLRASMLLAIDIGNTAIHLGLFSGRTLRQR